MPKEPTEGEMGLVVDIQRCAMHDGPGIRTIVFFKGCPLRCAWCQNPESLESYPEIGFVGALCIQSGSCNEACDRDAIDLSSQLRILRDACDGCALCVKACMSDALSLVGEDYTVERLLDLVLRDADFYAESGGGITLSGGEPLRQHRFLAAFLPAAKTAGLHVTVETCGYFPWDPVEPLLAYIDLIYFDIKVRDGDAHRAATGVDNGIILENARRLVERGHDIIFRCPLIPGYTSGEENLDGIISLLQEWDQPTVHLLPYHNLGEGKLAKVDSPLPPLNLVSMPRKDALIIGERFAAAGITPIIGGS